MQIRNISKKTQALLSLSTKRKYSICNLLLMVLGELQKKDH